MNLGYIDEEGLKNYLEFGYNVFGQTMIKDIKFMKPMGKY